MHRYYVISEKRGLVAVCDGTQAEAEDLALRVAVAGARTVYLHDRLTELEG